MKVFFSWSGELSRKIAEAFNQWLPQVIQAVKPYFSPEDITKGSRWSTEIAKELSESKIGVIFLTRENCNKPWILFEAGTISKNFENSKVCPLLFDMEPTEIEQPLAQFQLAKFSKEEIKKVIKMINSELEQQALTEDLLNKTFEKSWPELDKQIRDILHDTSLEKNNTPDEPSDRDILEEILSMTRNTNAITQLLTQTSELKYEAICHFVSSSQKRVLAINSTMQYNNDMWGKEKSQKIIEDSIKLLDCLDSSVENLDKKNKDRLFKQIEYVLTNALKLYSFFCDSDDDNTDDIQLILNKRYNGFCEIQKRYNS